MGAVAAVQAAGAIAGLFSNSKDTERLARNLSAYNLAIGSRNQAAVDFLAGRAGLFGPAGHMVASMGDKDTPGLIGTWATAKAATDAKTKYDALNTAGVTDATGRIVAAATPATATGTTTATTAILRSGLTSTSIPLWLWLVAGGVSAWLYVKYGRK